MRQCTVDTLTALVLAEARRQPLVLILEDVHWMDKATEEVVGTLVEAMVEVPLLLLLVYRPEYMHAWADRAYHAQITLRGLVTTGGAAMVRAILTKPYASRVPLEPLSPVLSTAMAQELLGTATIPPEVEALIVTQTQGNPLFIEELTRSLCERGALVPTPAGYTLTRPVATLELPTTVQGVLLARIDRLHDDLKTVLQVAAVIGRVVSYPVLVQAVQRGIALDQLLLELEDLEFLYPSSLAPQREYSFKHVLLQVVVYETLLRPQRQALHARVGEAMEGLYANRLEACYEALAHHFGHSAHTEKALQYATRAGEKAAGFFVLDQAVTYYQQASACLDTLEQTPERMRQQIALALQWGATYRPSPELIAALETAQVNARELHEATLVAKTTCRLGGMYFQMGWYDPAVQHLQRVIALADVVVDEEAVGLAYLYLAHISLFCSGVLSQSITYCTRGLPVLRRAGSREQAGLAGTLGVSYGYIGHFRHGIPWLAHALEQTRTDGHRTWETWAWYWTGKLRLGQGVWDVSVTSFDQALQLSLETDNLWAVALSSIGKGYAMGMAGDDACGVALMREGIQKIEKMEQLGALLGMSWNYAHLAELLCLHGEREEAITYADKALGRQAHGDHFGESVAHRALALAAAQATPPDWDQVETHMHESMRLAQEQQARPWLSITAFRYAELLHRKGALKQAQDYLSQAIELFHAMEMPWWLDQAEQLQARMEGRS